MAANYCQRCGNALSPGASFCANCGGAAQGSGGGFTYATANCPSCGRAEPAGAIFCTVCYQFLDAPQGVRAADLGRRVMAFIIDVLLSIFLLLIGWLIWLLFTARDGQTPGKRLLSIRAVRADGTPCDWGWTILRELGIKIAVFRILLWIVPVVGLIGWVADMLWPFWDRDRQALHDKIMKTVVIDEREYLQARPETQPGF